MENVHIRLASIADIGSIQTMAVDFYEHMGMHKDRTGDFPIGNGFYMNDYIMAKEISKKA